jgi:endoglucanase
MFWTQCVFFILSLQTIWSQQYSWTVDDGQILLNNKHVNLRGVSWFGFETQDFVVNGLWEHPMEWYVDMIHNLGINSVRLPFSAEWIIYNFGLYPYDELLRADPPLQHKTSIQIMDHFFDLCQKKGIVILLDLHRLHKEYISELWYSPTDDAFTTDTFFQTWFTILDRYQHYPNLIGIDLLNEPHGQATFGSGDYATDWKLFVEKALVKINTRFPQNNWLFFVEGIVWGHTFSDYRNHPFKLPVSIMKRLVFSPHVYGKSVVSTSPSDPVILHKIWYNDFGFLRHEYNKTVVPGEWGGQTYLDKDWMTFFGDYLIDVNMTNNFLWSLGPNSGDVAGLLLDNWTDLDTFKVSLLKRIVPSPTRFSFS